ncbi:DNA internalization-related competence protein ComEC/Rec2 [Acidobacteriota bacterium]
MAFPFLFISLALSSGILFASLTGFSADSFIPFFAGTLLLVWILYWIKKYTAAFAVLLLTISLGGSFLYSFSLQQYRDNTLRTFRPDSYVDITGTLYRSPVRGVNRDYLFIQSQNIRGQNREDSLRGRLRISVEHSDGTAVVRRLLPGDRIRISAKLSDSPGFRNFDGSPSDRAREIQGIHANGYTKSPLLVEKLADGSALSPLRWIGLLRRTLQDRIQKIYPGLDRDSISKHGSVVEALLLGARDRIPAPFLQKLQDSGLFHLFAISGAHIGILSFMLFWLLRLVQIPHRMSYTILLFFLIFYAFLVEGRPSVLRATTMACAYLLGKIFWKDTNLLNTLSISAFFLLLLNPMNLFSLGFQLTFCATLSIILFYPRVMKYLPSIPLRISELLALSFTAQIGVMPLVAQAFNRVTFSSILLNIAAIPLVGVIMGGGYLLLVMGFLSMEIAKIAGSGLGLLIDLMEHISSIPEHISFLSIRVPTPSTWILLGFYVSVLLFLLPRKFKFQRICSILCFTVFFLILILHPFRDKPEHLRMTLLDVGQGESILVEFPNRSGTTMLIDGGGFPRGDYDVGERVVSRFLWNKGIKHIDYLVLTHAHPDHLLGLISVARNFSIGEFWEARQPRNLEAYSNLVSTLSPTTLKKLVLSGLNENISGVRLQVHHPSFSSFEDDKVLNDHSIVLDIQYGQTSFLLTGDIGKEIEERLTQSNGEMKSQVLKSPHHGSRTSSTEGFLEAVSPEIIIISVGYNNLYGHPAPEILKRYEKRGASVYRTDRHGAIEISSDGNSLSIRTAVD